MENKTILKLLTGVKLFNGFGPGDLTDLLAHCSKATFKAGDMVFQEGDTGYSAYTIISGKVEVFRKTWGKERQLARLGPGESFGEMALVLSGEVGRTASVRAAEDTYALKIERDALAHIPHAASKLYLNISRTLAQRLKIATDIVVLQAQMGAEIDPEQTLGIRKRKSASEHSE